MRAADAAGVQGEGPPQVEGYTARMITRKNQDTRCAGFADGLQRSTARVMTATRKRIELCSRGEEGSTIAEMALVLPVMLAVLTGIFSFGVGLNQYLVLTNAVNNGARAFAMSAPSTDGGHSIMDSGDPCRYAAQTVQASAGTLNSTNLTYTIIYTVNSTSAQTTYTGTGSSLPTCTNLAMHQLDMVQVKAVYPITPALYGWANRTLNLTAISVEMVQ